ncbi:A disintegrin and metalloproteinase with thrombospondin motifs 2-like [Chelonus insularis]|uniref:A disintegrin and metalloproteinase with thrombospondin motifs 2-like n=1 Tax=Chelonus insularis TaxID=460826 RepID=UPI00158C9018|nr:A disintegrin and metalloproteinase with thrombospondin motifs 2-like [Chelonus insularis]
MPQPAQWLELGVAVDYSVIEFHGERIQQYIFALLNIVRAIYRDPSLGANLTIVIVRIIFYIDKDNKMIYQGNARTSLENVNKWNRKILSSSNKLHDVAVWLTRLDIGGPSGYAPVSGACDPSRSCALNRDEGLTSAFIIAHEIAHILGLTHDGDDASDNSCSYEASEGSIMAPVVSATFHRFHWSPCSRKEFYHRSKQWECMNNPPSFNNSTHLKTTLRDTFTMDEQCRMEFGDGYELCKRLNLPGICIHLWCAHKDENQMCKTKKGPPLEGTQCDKDKWCINGYCETVDHNIFTLGSSINNLVDSKWSPWSLWSKCSVTCGIGVQIRRRQCNNLTPFSDGRDCDGNSTDFRICKEKDCPQIIDLRSEQCSQLANIIKDKTPSRKNQVTWLPYEHEDKSLKCRLTCRNVETKEIYISNDFLIDGTRCSYDSTNICIQGKCHLMGCDNVLYSKKGLDQCGICDGDNSTCISVSNKFQRRIRRATTRVVIVPPASYDILVSIKTIPMPLEYESSKIVFRDAQRHKHEISLNLQSYVTVMIVEGTKFKIQKNDNQYEITGRGPTLATVTISLKIPKYEVKKSLIILVSFRYMTNRENEDSNNKYSWISGGWSPCSHSCGGGVRYRTVACRNEQDGRIVNNKKCSLVSKPTQEMEKCNTFSCQFKWITGMWEGCTKTCGASGVQQRQIYCVHSSFPDNYVTNDNKKKIYQVMVPPDLCNQYQLPKNQQECNRIPCQGNWLFTDWSPCTRSCAKGIQSRMARCVPPEAENLFTCNGTAPNELRTCKNSEHSPVVCEKNCKRNKSRYCVIPNLKKYCIIPEFYKRCCRTCLN